MKVFNKIDEIRDWRKSAKGKTGFVPTMGNLHSGHISLIRRMVNECDTSIVSIFVNPLQFGEGEDFNKYPKTLEDDLKICRDEGVDTVFVPEEKEIYPEEEIITVDPGYLGRILCGKDRPGHFRGVLTVVNKLFMIVKPEIAYFGKKDYQQYILIKRMCYDLNIPVKIIGCELVREESESESLSKKSLHFSQKTTSQKTTNSKLSNLAGGPAAMALSSRNRYLSSDEREDALLISKALFAAKTAFSNGEKNSKTIKKIIEEIINSGINNKIIYIECIEPDKLESKDILKEKDIIAVAVKTGSTRLIDNIEL